jgi:trk system potassium uptake protein TrkA
MRAIVVGAGDVGYDVARMLSLQRHDVTVIDVDAEKVNHIRDSLDVMAIRGSGTSARVLGQARILDADLLVAVTDVDEVNLVASMIAERVGKKTVTIARVRSEDFVGTEAVLSLEDFGLDLIIHPEESTAAEAVALLRRASATDIVEFADGRVQLVGIRMDRESPVVGRTLQEVAEANDHLTFRIAGIARGARTIIPRGDERIQKNDQVFVLVEAGQVPQVIHVLGKSGARLDHVMILGGSKVAGRIAARLCEQRSKRRVNVKLIEPDRATAERLAEELEGALVIHGDPSDMDLLVIEGVGDMDAFVAVTNDEESNLVSCLMAKHLGVRKTVAMLSKSAYIPISQSIGLDAAVSQKLAISREVLRFLRGKHVTSVATILGLDAEIIELEADPSSPITRAPLMKQKLPKGILVAAVVSPQRRGVEIATGSTHVQPGDHVIVFAMPDRVEEVEGYFGVGVASG